MYVCMYVYFYLNSQVHTGYKPNYMEANAIMRPIKKKKGGGRRRTVAKQQGGQFRTKINNCTNVRTPETEGTCGAIKCQANRRKEITSQYTLNCT